MTDAQHTQAALEADLRTTFVGKSLYCFDRIGSTNDFLLESAGSLPHGTVAFTTDQVAGKGRRGNAWAAPKGQTAAFSVLLKDTVSAAGTPPVALICGLAVARALGSLFGCDFRIKWPNDIVCAGKKVCGILCEARRTRQGGATVCGIGVNLLQDGAFFTQAGIPHGTSIRQITGQTPEAALVAAAILNAFEPLYTDLLSGAPEAVERFFADYSAHCVTLGREIRALTPQGELRGKAISVNRDGALLVQTQNGTKTLYAGDVSVRGVMGYV